MVRIKKYLIVVFGLVSLAAMSSLIIFGDYRDDWDEKRPYPIIYNDTGSVKTAGAFLLSYGEDFEDDVFCQTCVVWHFPPEADILEDMNRYYFLDLGMSVALPSEWHEVYGITGFYGFALQGSGRFFDMYEANEDSFSMFLDASLVLDRVPRIRASWSFPNLGRCGCDDEDWRTIFLRQDDEYIYFAQIRKNVFDVSRKNAFEALLAENYAAVLNSFRIIPADNEIMQARSSQLPPAR